MASLLAHDWARDHARRPGVAVVKLADEVSSYLESISDDSKLVASEPMATVDELSARGHSRVLQLWAGCIRWRAVSA